MSLNRSEQMILDYVQGHPEERQYWMTKVQSLVRAAMDDSSAAASIEMEIWAYYCERSRVVEPFKGIVAREGLRRTSMKNLAEYWIRLWIAPRKKAPAHGEGGRRPQ